MKKVLIIEDEASMALTLKEYLSPSYDVSNVFNGNDGLSAIKEECPDVVLLDLNLPDMHGFDVLKTLQNTRGLNKITDSCAIIVITGQGGMNAAIDAMRLGVHDFIVKPAMPERLQVCIKNALERVALKEKIKEYKELSRDSFQGFVGRSSKMQAIYKILENAAQSKASVFITGESGTGKELAARAVHDLSVRANRSFEVLNCAAIPHNLLESEIFGHVKGAFTGANVARQGAAMRANGGTLFLDEIGEMPVELQAKLLRFIQSGSFMPVGGAEEQHVDIRFICATNRYPMVAIKDGLLREDLYYRLNVIPVEMPPLREREEDVLLLARRFMAQIAREENKEFSQLSKGVESLFIGYGWPGNVRELENIIRRVVVLNEGKTIELKHLNVLKKNFDAKKKDKRENVGADSDHKAFLPENKDDIKLLEEYEREIILAALRICDGNITQAAVALGINPATIHRKRKQWREASSF